MPRDVNEVRWFLNDAVNKQKELVKNFGRLTTSITQTFDSFTAFVDDPDTPVENKNAAIAKMVLGKQALEDIINNITIPLTQ